MKISRPRTTKKVWIAIAILAVVLLAATYVYVKKESLFSSHTQPNAPMNDSGDNNRGVNYGNPSDQQIDLGNEIKKQSIEKDTDSNPKKDVEVTITASTIQDEALHIRTLINTIASSGICELTLTNSKNPNESISEKVETYNLPSSSTCKGFDIDLSRLTSADTWNARITYTGAENSAGSTTKEINLDE